MNASVKLGMIGRLYRELELDLEWMAPDPKLLELIVAGGLIAGIASDIAAELEADQQQEEEVACA